jgi:glycosyltransferase involved in cell wall biosynthesis
MGGMENGVLKLVNNLERSQFEPHLIAIRGHDPKAYENLVDTVRFASFDKKDGRDWSMVSKLARYFRDHRIDIVHSHNWETFLYSFLAAKRARVPVFVHGEHGRDTESLTDSRAKKLVKRLLAWQSHHLTTVSQDIAEMMIEYWHVPRDKVTVIRNGVDFDRFYSVEQRHQLKATLGLDANGCLLGTVIGNLRPVKDLPTLLRALSIIRARHSNVHLVVVGNMGGNDSRHLVEVKNLIRELQLQPHVTFAGSMNDVSPYMQAIDVYVNCSVYEGMSNTLLEAMACGAAVVATAVGGTPFIVRDGVTGLLVPPKLPQALAGAIERLVAEEGFRTRLQVNGRRHVQAHHGLERFVSQHEDLYLKLSSRKRYASTEPMLSKAEVA